MSKRRFVTRTLLSWLRSRPRLSWTPSRGGTPRATNQIHTFPKSRQMGRQSPRTSPMLLMELLRTVPDRCPPEQGCIPHERSELDRYRLCLGMRVSHQHPWVSVAANGGDFRHVETLLEEPAYGFMTQIVEPQATYARSPSQALPCKPECVG